MPTDKLDIENIFMIDANTGEKTEIKGVTNITVTTEDKVEYEPFISPREISFDVEISEELREKLLPKKLVCSGSPKEIGEKIFRDFPLECKILGVHLKQNRIHRKRRINKKWAKRYGYTCKVFYK
ncbi:hypothetical protein ACR77J_12110 [Tissierella praeacuta]|uniref:hypothetical protein n=1 Tax=Tissierella praeacuta TaxID=43131 RepID=UPI0010510021|nr:hypothetical protein [Tissierella praeacuta]TCU72870.1 hypothetical protein EV204_105206 [Tissierella praeacuta]